MTPQKPLLLDPCSDAACVSRWVGGFCCTHHNLRITEHQKLLEGRVFNQGEGQVVIGDEVTYVSLEAVNIQFILPKMNLGRWWAGWWSMKKTEKKNWSSSQNVWFWLFWKLKWCFLELVDRHCGHHAWIQDDYLLMSYLLSYHGPIAYRICFR